MKKESVCLQIVVLGGGCSECGRGFLKNCSGRYFICSLGSDRKYISSYTKEEIHIYFQVFC